MNSFSVGHIRMARRVRAVLASIAFGYPNALVKGQSPLRPPNCYERRNAVIEKTHDLHPVPTQRAGKPDLQNASGPIWLFSAGIYAASRGKKTLLIEKKRIGGIIGNVSTVTHYTAIMQPETGESFATRMWNQIKNCGVEIINEEVVSTSLKGDVKSVTTDKNTYSAKKSLSPQAARLASLTSKEKNLLTKNTFTSMRQRTAKGLKAKTFTW